MQFQKKGTTLKSIGTALKSVPGWVPAAAFVIILSLGTGVALAQAAPAGPAQQAPAATPSAPAAQAPYLAPPPAPVAKAVPADPLPPADPRAFTAASPTLETVNAFLNQVWGYDPDRLWRVMAIQSTDAPNVSKVIVFIIGKSADAKPQAVIMYVTPDGNHIIQGSTLVPFGATPYAATRDLLKAKATGAARGAAGKDLMLVEFADLQCPYCKVAQATMDQIVKDFPAARVVFQQFPLADIHPSSFKAAAYGVCAQKQSDEAFFKYAAGVFDTQEALAPATEDTLLRAAAQRAGLDGPAIVACARHPGDQGHRQRRHQTGRRSRHRSDAHAGGQRPRAPARHSLRHDQADHRLPGQAGRGCHRGLRRYSGPRSSAAVYSAYAEQPSQIEATLHAVNAIMNRIILRAAHGRL